MMKFEGWAVFAAFQPLYPNIITVGLFTMTVGKDIICNGRGCPHL